MFEGTDFINFFSLSSKFIGQVIVQPNPDAARDAALVFSGPQFFSALVSGVVMAFAFQLLLTNLGVAAGISLLGGSSSSDEYDSQDDSGGLGTTIRKISLVVGLGTLVSVTIAVFFACTFAVKLSLFASPVSGAIVGLVIWATYFSLLIWVSSATIGSLIGSVVNSATSGFQAILGTAAAAIGTKAASKEVVATAEAAVSAVRREIGAAIDPVSLRENVEEYIETIRPRNLDLDAIASDFEQILDDDNLQEIVSSDSIKNINRQTFVDLVSDRSDLSKKDINKIADKLESVWRKTLKKVPPQQDRMGEFVDYLKSASREQLVGNELSDKLNDLVYEIRQRRKSTEQGSAVVPQSLSTGFNALAGIVMGRTDLSDFDVERVTDQLQQFRGYLGDQTDKIATRVGVKDNTPPSTVRKDIENYLLNSHPWQLKPQNLEIEFRDLIYDPAADPGTVADELRKINYSDFTELLDRKGLLTQTKIKTIANILEGIRLEILAVAEAAQEREASIAVFAEVEEYLLKTPRNRFTPEKIRLDFKPILEDHNIDYEHLNNRLSQFDRPTFERLLESRGDFTSVEIAAIANELETVKNSVLKESSETFGVAKTTAEAQWRKVQSYLRDTGREELNPMVIERELKLLLDDPDAGAAVLKARMSQFDRNTLVQLLTIRNDLDEQQVNEVIDSVERAWTRVRYTPQKLALRAQEQYQQAIGSISQYLRDTGKKELSPQGIKRDLQLLLNDPKLGAKAIRQRLAAIDRDTLVQLLSQRDDLEETQVNQVIDEVQNTIRAIAKSPRRIATRTQQQVKDFQSSISEYLSSTEKEELNPQGIKRDIQLLINDPRSGMESIQERLSQFDRSTLVALLSQRDDLSQEEINGVIDQILSVRDQFLQQWEAIQQRMQAVVDNFLDKIRRYLNSLERSELNYEGIKRDITTLFDDPEAGFEALRDRFSQVDSNTLVAVLSSRDDISKADAQRIVTQVERTRDRVLQRAERIQQEAQIRLEKIRLEARRQAEETRKAAAVASWWLFLTALISALGAVAGGATGVIS
ncbi:MAG: MFS transporter [Cyanobacteria bacterium P01_A01_bin.84]